MFGLSRALLSVRRTAPLLSALSHSKALLVCSVPAWRGMGSAPSPPPAAAVAAPTDPTPEDVAAAASAPAAPQSLLSAYMELSKARLSALVVLTSGAGFLLAGHPIDWGACAVTVVGTSLAAASANTFNQVYEVRPDGLMMRTMRRPLPSGRLTRGAAVTFGLATAAASGALLWTGANPLTTALGIGNILLYAAVYTPLKQITVWNTGVGAVVGAVPPLMGWAAATGSLAAWDPWLLGYLLFAWQLPHFYALAWLARKDYARGGYAMVPVFDPTGARTAALMWRHSLGLAAVPFLATALGVTSPMFAVDASVLNAYLLYRVGQFKGAPSDPGAKAVFRLSLWYLPVIMGLLVFHASMWDRQEDETLAGRLAVLTGGPPRGKDGRPAERPEGLRGITIGEGIEHAVACTRSLGRAWCAHEVWWRSGGASASGSASGPAPASAPLPAAVVVTATAEAGAPALATSRADLCPVKVMSPAVGGGGGAVSAGG